MNGVNIEPADVRDAEEILDLQKLAYQSEAAIYGDYGIPPLIQTHAEMEADFQENFFLKASHEGKIIGSVRGSLSRGTCYVGRLIVHPAHQGKGLGTSLMSEIEKRFPEAERYELFTGHKSEGNLRLYARLGYRVFKREKISGSLEFIYLEKVRESGVRGQGSGISP